MSRLAVEQTPDIEHAPDVAAIDDFRLRMRSIIDRALAISGDMEGLADLPLEPLGELEQRFEVSAAQQSQ
jgi:hypothetical protein